MIELERRARTLNGESLSPIVPVEVLKLRAKRIRKRNGALLAAVLLAVAVGLVSVIFGLASPSPSRVVVGGGVASRASTSTTTTSEPRDRIVSISKCLTDSISYTIANRLTKTTLFDVTIDMFTRQGKLIRQIGDHALSVEAGGTHTEFRDFSEFPGVQEPSRPARCVVVSATQESA
jgi:hypothetical protein